MKSLLNTLLSIPILIIATFIWCIEISFNLNKINGIAEEATLSEKVTDAVCKMKIDKDAAIIINFKGKNFYFCSNECKYKFGTNPKKFSCICFFEIKEGDEFCKCAHCSGEGVMCDCTEKGHPYEQEKHMGSKMK